MRLRTSHTLIRLTLASALTAAGVLSAPATPLAQSIAQQETMMSVRQALEQAAVLRRVRFSFVRRGSRHSDASRLHISWRPGDSDAASAVKRVSGVDEVTNAIEVLPTSQNDDRIRWATFYPDLHGRLSVSLFSGGFVGAWGALVILTWFRGCSHMGTPPDPHHREARAHDAGRCRGQRVYKQLTGLRQREVAECSR